MKFGPMKGKIAVEAGVEHQDARAKVNEALISGELRTWGLRKSILSLSFRVEKSKRTTGIICN
jgi:hypothetical protein